MTNDQPLILDATTALDILRAKRAADGPGVAAMYSSYLGGVVTDPALMSVPLDDHMVHRGHGVFDTASLHNGRIYRLGIHVDRMLASASAARIDHSFTAQSMKDMVVDAVAASGLRNGSIRYWLTAGPGGFSLGPDECSEACFYCVVFQNFNPAGGDDPAAGHPEVTITDTPMKPPLLANIKSNNYLLNVLTHLEASDRGGLFGILVDDDGFVAEGAVVNVCFITTEDRVLITPPFDGILKGTTVRRVLEFAADVLVAEGLISAVEQRPVRADEVRGAVDEMFLIGGDTHMFPVTAWDGIDVGTGKTGPIATRLLALLEDEAEDGSGPALADREDQFIEVEYAESGTG